MNERAETILDFWFIQTSPKEKFANDKDFDKKIRDNFFDDYKKAVKNEYDDWRENADECLALIILLDQFSRNMFRNNPKAFAMDKKARLLSQHAIDQGYCEKFTKGQLIFVFLPFMHSEDLSDQVYCGKLIDSYLKHHESYKESKKFSKLHHDIINEFGRFPYRNKVLRRKNTIKETEYLKSTHYGFFNI
jgi:uncharacterized protein (DUF924 family)